MWDLPGSGVKPASPKLAGGFFTTEPPGKSYYNFFMPYKSYSLMDWHLPFHSMLSSALYFPWYQYISYNILPIYV